MPACGSQHAVENTAAENTAAENTAAENASSGHGRAVAAAPSAATGVRNASAAQHDTPTAPETATSQGARNALPSSTVTFRPIGAPDVVVHAELARDWVADPAIAAHPYFNGRVPMETERGLMFRTQLGADVGMLFLFRQPRHMTFWMMNTNLPLDIIFISEEMRVLGTAENATPHTTSGREVDGVSKYVLEVNAGFAREHRITPGTHVSFADVPNVPEGGPDELEQ